MLEKQYFEDCRVGEQVVTPGRTITETDIVWFAAFTGDWNSIHSDAEFARGQPFGERVAHGLLSLVIGFSLLFRLGQHALFPKSLVALSGLEKVRFVEPVRIGDTLHLEAEILEMTRLANETGIIELRYRVRNQRQELVVGTKVKVVAGCRPVSGNPEPTPVNTQTV
jgi:acyl dehydratase